MNPYALAMLVLCTATLLQLIVQTLWSAHSARAFRAQCDELGRLRKRVIDRLATPHELLELTREHVDLLRRIDSIERQVGVIRSRPPATECEPAPVTKRAGM